MGDGVLKSELAIILPGKKAKTKGRFLGFIPPEEVVRILEASDVFALSSAYEGMPICVLEALSYGVPVVATEVGAVTKLVEPAATGDVSTSQGETGFLAALLAACGNTSSYDADDCALAAAPYTHAKNFSKISESHLKQLRRMDGVCCLSG